MFSEGEGEVFEDDAEHELVERAVDAPRVVVARDLENSGERCSQH